MTISTKEFEEELLILGRRNHKLMPHKKHFYLLQGLIYLQEADGKTTKLTCVRPNFQRTPNGIAYYCIPSSAHNFPATLIDDQITEHLAHSHIHPERIPDI